MYQEGQRTGFAIAALALSLVAFINLLNIEKSLLAIVLGVLAVRGATKVERAYSWGRIAVIVAIVHIIGLAILIVVYHSKLFELLRFLQELG